MVVLCAMTNYSTSCSRLLKYLPAWWTTRCSNLSKQNKFYLKKVRLLVFNEHWLNYKQTSAKLRQVVRDSKWHYSDSVSCNAKTFIFCIRFSVNSKIVWVLLRIHTFVCNLMTPSFQMWMPRQKFLLTTLVRNVDTNQPPSLMEMKLAFSLIAFLHYLS